jgi:hypothetical protein
MIDTRASAGFPANLLTRMSTHDEIDELDGDKTIRDLTRASPALSVRECVEPPYFRCIGRFANRWLA